jgi:hypothetical protein
LTKCTLAALDLAASPTQPQLTFAEPTSHRRE